MSNRAIPPNRKFRIIAQDPSVLVSKPDGQVLTTQITIPFEPLLPGPWGHRVQVIDYNQTEGLIYLPTEHIFEEDPFLGKDTDILVNNYRFHAQNVYAIVMHTLTRFEKALGRHVDWIFDSHQLKVVPHAFYKPNAFYSRAHEALLFGYFSKLDGSGMVFTCLSYDVVVHETAHALLDSLRQRLNDPSSLDQSAFHEAFADITALLSVFSLPDIIKTVLKDKPDDPRITFRGVINESASIILTHLKRMAFSKIAEQLGQNQIPTSGVLSDALRSSVNLKPEQAVQSSKNYQTAYERGEVLVAAVMNTFLDIWVDRLSSFLQAQTPQQDEKGLYTVTLDCERTVEEGKDIADYLLTMLISALDYMPPLHIDFSDFLSAIITADQEIHPDDSRYGFREHLRKKFTAYGIEPATGTAIPTRLPNPSTPTDTGAWVPFDQGTLTYSGIHFEPLITENNEVYRFIWQNRKALGIFDGPFNQEAYSRVLSVRPCYRISPDGFVLKETVVEFYQVIRKKARELYNELQIPEEIAEIDPEIEIPLYGGGTLIFDEFGQLKYYIHNSIDNPTRQEPRIKYLWETNALPERRSVKEKFFASSSTWNPSDLERYQANHDPQEEW